MGNVGSSVSGTWTSLRSKTENWCNTKFLKCPFMETFFFLGKLEYSVFSMVICDPQPLLWQIKTGRVNHKNTTWQVKIKCTYFCHSGHHNIQWRTCSFFGLWTKDIWCCQCNAPHCRSLHSKRHGANTLQGYNTSNIILIQVDMFTLSTVAREAQEEHEDHVQLVWRRTNIWTCVTSSFSLATLACIKQLFRSHTNI